MVSQATIDIKAIREETGISVAKCKKAYEEASGDIDEALKALRIAGETKAEELSESRTTNFNRVVAYVHHTDSLGAIIDIGCETDFSAGSEELRSLGAKLCMHIVASRPSAISEDDICEADLSRSVEEFRMTEAFQSKPENVQAKMIDGFMKKYVATNCLLAQKFVIDESQTVAEVIAEVSAKLGEKIEIHGFSCLGD